MPMIVGNKHEFTTLPTHSNILDLDKERVNYIHSKLLLSSKNNKIDQKLASSANLTAKSGSLIGSANYFVTVGLGTPIRNLSLVFDTGSDLTWTQCQPCSLSCYNQQDDIFDPSMSTSYSNITCTSSDCTQIYAATGRDPRCARLTNACIYKIQYADESFSEGYISQERLTITQTDAIDNFLFGCGQNNQGLFNGSAGLLGLGRHPISFIEQTSQLYNKTFSYCLPSTSSDTSYLTFGATNDSDVKYTPFSNVSNNSSFYGLDIIGISVGGTQLPISSSTFFSGGAIIDSGTVITRLPLTAYVNLRDSFQKGMTKYPIASSFSILDTCYDFSGNEMISIPKIRFFFRGGVAVELAALGILYAESLDQVCLAFAANEDDSDITIFGNVQQRTLKVVYDVGGGKIGFGSNGCK
ncbi:aspartyl protease family protein At5g10770-like [Trifolium pratense]|uniref:aspartyl protease family protein At5g10770-like n=1 Tax=Trifolium pratense TaxID=57577 RepID=UPI001E6919AB|nr:aspartyl protease family protein At5g10770-like [Trifolium pratense]